jgi:hypothetical protein
MRHFLIAFVFLVAGCGSQTPPPAPQPVANAVPVIDPQDYDRSRAAVRESLPEQDRPKFDKAVKLSKNRHQLDGKTGSQILDAARNLKQHEVESLKLQIHRQKQGVVRLKEHVDIAMAECEKSARRSLAERLEAESYLNSTNNRLTTAEVNLMKLEEELGKAKDDLKALK